MLEEVELEGWLRRYLSSSTTIQCTKQGSRSVKACPWGTEARKAARLNCLIYQHHGPGSLCAAPQGTWCVLGHIIRSPQCLQSAAKQSCTRVPLEVPSPISLLESEQTPLNNHQRARPRTSSHKQDIQRRKWRHWARFPVEASNWTWGNDSARPWVNQITFAVLWTCLNRVLVSNWLQRNQQS